MNNKKYKAILSDSLIFLIVILLFFLFVSSTAYTANIKLEKHFLQEENKIENIGLVEKNEATTNKPSETLPSVSPSHPTEPIIEYQDVEYATNEIFVIGGRFIDDIRAAVFTDVKLVRAQLDNENWLMNDLYKIISENNTISVYVITIKANEYPSSFDLWSKLNSLAETFQNKHFVYLNIGPVDDTKQLITNELIVQYNQDAVTNLFASWQIIDLHSYLLADGYKTGSDGIKYDMYTNISIFVRLIEAVKTQTIIVEKGA